MNTDDPWGWGRSPEWATSSPFAAAQRHLAATNQIRIASLRLAPARGRTGRDAANDAEIEACVYVACYAGGTDLTGCATEKELYFPIESQLGFRGCCRVGNGSLEVEYSCTTGWTSLLSNDNADFFLHVCARDVPEATSYEVSAGF